MSELKIMKSKKCHHLYADVIFLLCYAGGEGGGELSNSERLTAVNYCCNALHLRYLSESWIRLWVCSKSKTKHEKKKSKEVTPVMILLIFFMTFRSTQCFSKET